MFIKKRQCQGEETAKKSCENNQSPKRFLCCRPFCVYPTTNQRISSKIYLLSTTTFEILWTIANIINLFLLSLPQRVCTVFVAVFAMLNRKIYGFIVHHKKRLSDKSIKNDRDCESWPASFFCWLNVHEFMKCWKMDFHK